MYGRSRGGVVKLSAVGASIRIIIASKTDTAPLTRASSSSGTSDRVRADVIIATEGMACMASNKDSTRQNAYAAFTICAASNATDVTSTATCNHGVCLTGPADVLERVEHLFGNFLRLCCQLNLLLLKLKCVHHLRSQDSSQAECTRP